MSAENSVNHRYAAGRAGALWGTLSLALGLSAGAHAAQSITVDARSNLFYAGTDSTVQSPGETTGNHCPSSSTSYRYGDGVKAPYLPISSGVRSIQITSKYTTIVGFGGSFNPRPNYSTPDGTYWSSASVTTSYNVTAFKDGSASPKGLRFANRFGTLAAIFWDETLYGLADIEYANRTNPTSDVNVFSAAQMNAATVSYGQRESFFIGDGLTKDFVDTNWPGGALASTGTQPDGTEQRQTIMIPSGGTRLYLGFADASGVNGVNCSYYNNSGGVIVSLMQSVSDDTGAATAGAAATAILNVLANDTADGAQPVAGVNNITLAPVDSTDENATAWGNGDGITLDTNSGAVSIAATTPAGIYKKWYQMCDTTTSPASCSSALITVAVSDSPLPVVEAVADTKSLADVVTADTVAIANVRVNDTVDGVEANATNSTIVTEGVWTGFQLDTASGKVSVVKDLSGAYPTAGNYTLPYKLCQLGSDTNCKSTTVSITIPSASVTVATIVARNNVDTNTHLEGTAFNLDNVVSDDSYGGNPAAIGTAGATVKLDLPNGASLPAGVTLNTQSGTVNVANTVLPGNYVFTYRICDNAVANNCATATVSFSVTAATIVAANDPITATPGTAQAQATNVLGNDSYNGNPAAAADVTLTQEAGWPTWISLDMTTGDVSVTAAAVVGDYTLPYKICANTPSAPCREANVLATVISIAAVDNALAATAGTAQPKAINVLSNDSYNGNPAAAADVILAQGAGWPAWISLDTTTGDVSVTAAAVVGNYNLPYSICAATADKVCSTAKVVVTVSSIAATDDPLSVTAGTAQANAINVLSNDHYNGSAPTLANTTIAQGPGWPAWATLNTTDGQVSISADAQVGDYKLPYTVCAKDPSTLCSTANVLVTVTAAGAVTSTPTPVPTLSPWAMALLTLALGSAGWITRRNKR